MRTTLDLDEDVLSAARALASARREPMGKVVSELARQSLQSSAPEWKRRAGVPVLARRPGPALADEVIDRIREDEGI